MLETKSNFEKLAAEFDVLFKANRAGNGAFKYDLIRTHENLKQQSIIYSGVGIIRQNSIAKRHIRTISEKAKSMLLHAIICWTNIESWIC